MKIPALVIKQSELWTAIRDRYPKAKHHFLILPNQSIPRLTDVTLEHLPLLQSMHQAAEELALSFAPSDFRIGYHSVPSMLQLHLHVISTDFCSPCLKTKKHWNSFNTEFFIPSNVFMQMVQQGSHSKIPHDPKYGLFLKQELRCHKCPDSFRTMPQLKAHLKIHFGTEMESVSATQV
ncbi:hypothetical protein EG68_03547 [Paragonimus skrjabini miyazakii]|uniref:Aprataxin n=1 Tax=Paragonimus skrjabini miyazakii TaxID=59628 RepID=A0A8S9Z3J6_9TREM|nr:hypothetical protein EG68_03547 [Paragonimus skrjabini miyazakii]